jgi:hypothetical protein
MPTISMFYGILIQMFWDENAPPHFHATYGEFKATIDIRVHQRWQPAMTGGPVGAGLGGIASG